MIYEQQWDSAAYLRCYYSGAAVSADEVANAEFVAAELGALGRTFDNALELGCGPTVHHAASLAPFARSLHLADYLPENLREVRRWLDDAPGAHDWDVYLSGVLAREGAAELAQRKALLRERVTALRAADIRQPLPLGAPAEYDLVASFYCLEAVARDRAEWAGFLANVAPLVRPGGVLLLGAMRRCREYHVFDDVFPSAYVDEADLAAELPALGFPASGTTLRVVEGVGWATQGFDGICCVRATRASLSGP